jgi:hypothetical protein
MSGDECRILIGGKGRVLPDGVEEDADEMSFVSAVLAFLGVRGWACDELTERRRSVSASAYALEGFAEWNELECLAVFIGGERAEASTADGP